jgi:uncharacterized BrkB/YihY/UPF0761 family membrane protein
MSVLIFLIPLAIAAICLTSLLSGLYAIVVGTHDARRNGIIGSALVIGGTIGFQIGLSQVAADSTSVLTTLMVFSGFMGAITGYGVCLNALAEARVDKARKDAHA